MKKILVIVLTFVLSIGSIYGLYSILGPVISENAIGEMKPYLESFFPDASSFKEITFEDQTGLVSNVYQADGYGYAYKASADGYKAPITILIGIDESGNIVGLEILEFNDTVGIGDVVKEDSFIDSIVGHSSSEAFATLSGATYSSSAVVKSVNAAKAIFNTLKGIDGSDETPTPEPSSKALVISEADVSAAVVDPTETTVEGDVYNVVVRVDGYGAVNHGDKPNKFLVVVDKATQKIVSVSVTVFNDTESIGDAITQDKFLNEFKDISIVDETSSVDAASGATVSSKSAVSAVKAAIDYVLGQ